MRTYVCTCSNPLFYANTHCLSCDRDVAWCPVCRQISPLEGDEDAVCCGRPECQAPLKKCANAVRHGVCNRCVVRSESKNQALFCDCCSLNKTIPDLAVPGNLKKWYLLEQAKRLLIYDLEVLGLPTDGDLPLRFAFMGDTVTHDDQ